MIITGRRFTEIGEALFGPRKWYPIMAQMLDRDRSLIWKYATSKSPIPADMRSKLAALCRARGAALHHIADELES